MTQWKPLSPSKHHLMGWKSFTHYLFIANNTLAPICVSELLAINGAMPLAFTKTPKGNFQLVAVQGLESQQNLYVGSDGKWLGRYVPAVHRGYPFRLQLAENGSFILCGDMDAEWLNQHAVPEDTRVFNEQGELTPPMKDVVTFLQNVQKDLQRTRAIVAQLADANLMEPWPVTFPLPEASQGKQRIEGLYRISESHLRALPPEVLAKLTQSGALSVAYAQLLSQSRINDLIKRHTEGGQPPPNAEKVDLESLFNEGDDDFEFNFDA
nr:SapC family protein [uncultured Halomonas sp.]